MKNSRNKKLLACFLTALGLSANVQNSSASFRIAGFTEIKDNIASKFSKGIKKDDINDSNQLVKKINEFLKLFNLFNVDKEKKFNENECQFIKKYTESAGESDVTKYREICNDLYEYLKNIRNRREKNRTYSTLYKEINAKKYIKHYYNIKCEVLDKENDNELLYSYDLKDVGIDEETKKINKIDKTNLDIDMDKVGEMDKNKMSTGEDEISEIGNNEQADQSFNASFYDEFNEMNNNIVAIGAIKNEKEKYKEKYINADIIGIFPGSDASIESLQAWLNCVYSDIYGGNFTIWGNIEPALESLSTKEAENIEGLIFSVASCLLS